MSNQQSILSIGEVLRTARRRRGLRVVEVAKRLRISAPHISEVERNGRLPGTDLSVRWARLVGINAGHLAAEIHREKQRRRNERWARDLAAAGAACEEGGGA